MRPRTQLAYRAAPAQGGDAEAADKRSAAVLQAGIAPAGIDGATVSVAGDLVAIDVGRAELGAVAALAVPGELAIHDWEASVLGPDGRPAPGGPGLGLSARLSPTSQPGTALSRRSGTGGGHHRRVAQAGDDCHGSAAAALIVVLWRGGLRIRRP
jgi:hypothetical protein